MIVTLESLLLILLCILSILKCFTISDSDNHIICNKEKGNTKQR